MWKCSNCETVNNTEKCIVCGQEMPKYSANAQQRICVNCGAKLENGMDFCGECGTPQIKSNVNYIFCGNCGGKIPDTLQVCTNCGHKLHTQHLEENAIGYVMADSEKIKKKNLYLIPILLITLFFIGGILTYYFNLTYKSNDNVDDIVKQVDEIYKETFSEDDNLPVENDDSVDNNNIDEHNRITETAILNGSAVPNPSENGVYNNIQLTNVEEYIENTIRPIYYSITSNNNLVCESKTNDISFYYDDSIKSSNFGICWIRYAAGAYGNQYERRYYFDSRNGELVFAFIFLDEEEYRLYFYKNSIIRYIDNYGVSFDNPTDSDILNKAKQAIDEAYIYKE